MPGIYRLYVKLENDKAMPVTLQDKMAENLNANRVITIVSGHFPMISNVKQLAGILSDFVNEIVQDEKTTKR